VAFNRLGESIAETLRKGDHVLVDGQLVSSKYANESGKSKKAKSAKFRYLLERAREFRTPPEPGRGGKPRCDSPFGTGVGRTAILKRIA